MRLKVALILIGIAVVVVLISAARGECAFCPTAPCYNNSFCGSDCQCIRNFPDPGFCSSR